ncbi:MAG: Asr1405/Asl0597 family protein [Leptolyngbyaceae cyanobacterium]
MSPQQSDTEPKHALVTEIECCDRWQVYFRLQELDIPCQCQAHKPLSAEVRTADVALQIWSVVNRVSRPQKELATWLNHCWTLRCNA